MNRIYNEKTQEEILKENKNMKNPFGLVYDGAIEKNVPDEVNIIPISYDSDGVEIAANIYVPKNYDKTAKLPAIAVAHPNGGVKEQVAGLYAQRLAELGYIAMAFDAAYQGASGGVPRNKDVPSRRIEDIRRAADILMNFEGADPERIGILGICGGGGYTIKEVQTDKRYKSVATLSMFNSGDARRDGFLCSQTDTITDRMIQASEARAKEAMGAEPEYTPDMCMASEEEAAKLTYPLYRDGYTYYCKAYAHPNSTFRYTVSSLLELMSFDAATHAELINQPLLMMAGSAADSLYMTAKVYAAATGTEDKELFLIPGAGHIETYYKPEYVDAAVNKLNEFFGRTL